MFLFVLTLCPVSGDHYSVDLSPVIQTLSGLYILNAQDESTGNALKSDVERFVASGKYELLMEAKERNELVRMYTTGSDEIVDSFVMLSVESSETVFICLDGKMKREDLDKILAEAMKNM